MKPEEKLRLEFVLLVMLFWLGLALSAEDVWRAVRGFVLTPGSTGANERGKAGDERGEGGEPQGIGQHGQRLHARPDNHIGTCRKAKSYKKVSLAGIGLT
jgi:hypothetical protein